LCSLNYRVFVEKSFENPYFTNGRKLTQESSSILMNKEFSFWYELDMFTFLHYSKLNAWSLKDQSVCTSQLSIEDNLKFLT